MRIFAASVWLAFCIGFGAVRCDAQEQGQTPTGRLALLRKEAEPLIAKRDGWLLARDLTDAILEAVGWLRGEVAAGEEKLVLINLGRKMDRAVWERGHGAAAERTSSLLARTRPSLPALMKGFAEFSLAKTFEERWRLVEKTAPDVAAAIRPALPREPWSEEDDRALERVAAAARAATAEATAKNDLGALDGLELALELDRVLEDKEALAADIAALGATARKLLPREEAEWRIGAVADRHFDLRRYSLARRIYELAYDPMGELLGSGIYAAMRTVQCEWETGELERIKPADRTVAWKILDEMKERLIWDPRLEEVYFFAAYQMKVIWDAEHVNLLRPYMRMTMRHAADPERRYLSGAYLAHMVEQIGELQEAITLWQELSRTAPNQARKDYAAGKARELREKAQGPAPRGGAE
jgi:tetratricopeptide (TPR) repeat protein